MITIGASDLYSFYQHGNFAINVVQVVLTTFALLGMHSFFIIIVILIS